MYTAAIGLNSHFEVNLANLPVYLLPELTLAAFLRR
jgi:hypothetical protein